MDYSQEYSHNYCHNGLLTIITIHGCSIRVLKYYCWCFYTIICVTQTVINVYKYFSATDGSSIFMKFL